MKKFSLYTFLVAFCTVLFLSCDKAAEENTAGYSTFYLSMPTFSSAGGEKTHWDSQGLWWDESGDVVSINGDQHQIVYSDGAWGTTGGTSTAPVNNQYYICYMGKGNQGDAGWDPSTLKYTNVDLTSIVPLVGYGKTNFITLQPCCAVLLVHSFYEGDVNVAFSINIPNPADTCNISPVTYLIENPKTFVSSLVASRNDEGNAYFIIPMASESIFTTLTITNGQSDELSTGETEVEIKRGHVYRINRPNF